jgi:hypothetical protein
MEAWGLKMEQWDHWTRIRITLTRIREKLHPDSHYSEKRDPHYSDADPQPCFKRKS